MPAVPRPVSDRMITNGRLAILVTVLAWLAYVGTILVQEFVLGYAWTPRFGYEAVAYLLIVTLLTAASLAYLLARLAYFYRTRSHRRAARASIDELFSRSRPSLTVLVPSFQEDARVVRMTLLSAALQEYPDLRVVLLVDDPPHPHYGRERRLLEAVRALPGHVEDLLREPAARFGSALERFEMDGSGSDPCSGPELLALAGEYEAAVEWLVELAEAQVVVDHTDAFFAEHVVKRLASELAVTAAAVRSAAGEGASLPRERVRHLFRRLAWTFRAEIASFERKLFMSLSHEPSKAMNLNSYIGLMGGSYRQMVTPGGTALVPATEGAADLVVPNPDYLLTLDADSVLLPEYCVRMVHYLEQPDNARVAVAQTPYSAYPGAATRLERIAGATTDIQHIVHQGMNYYDAAFWVGANAVLRKRALDDIRETEYQGEWEIQRYIQDRTIIEDTDSSVDLRIHGWRLYNYPERLSYSSTPPDFGSLCIQRRRWACGGLLIIPKLWRQSRAFRSRGDRNRFGEYFLRVNYMGSIAWANVCVLLLLAYPFSNQLLSPLVIFVSLPYFVVMASDLNYCGYKWLDVFRIYGFNLVLLPVNLAGAGNSLMQWLTGEKVAFKRTPKVAERTTSPLLFVLLPYLLVGLSVYTVVADYQGGRWVNLIYAAINSVLATYAILAYVGLRNSLVDIWVNVLALLYKPEKAIRPQPAQPAGAPVGQLVPEWELVLHYGSADPADRPAAIPVTPVLARTEKNS
jgi:cellulose synthase/poly-beta-1,6-N-acetylglucosamine synthase-like glycosyltransferase